MLLLLRKDYWVCEQTWYREFYDETGFQCEWSAQSAKNRHVCLLLLQSFNMEIARVQQSNIQDNKIANLSLNVVVAKTTYVTQKNTDVLLVKYHLCWSLQRSWKIRLKKQSICLLGLLICSDAFFPRHLKICTCVGKVISDLRRK